MPPNAERPRARGANQLRRNDTESLAQPAAGVNVDPPDPGKLLIICGDPKSWSKGNIHSPPAFAEALLLLARDCGGPP